MNLSHHKFHIPVMGTGHSIDTPIRVAHFGISSVMSIIDDMLIEKMRKFYSAKFALPYRTIPRFAPEARSKRITAYLEVVQEIVRLKMEAVKKLPFFVQNDKQKYFDLLPDESPLKHDYRTMLAMDPGPERDAVGYDLTDRMSPGSIDVNIMVKIDGHHLAQYGVHEADGLSDAKAALKGFAESSLKSSVVFSAGLNQGMFGYLMQFRDFYRNAAGDIKKKIILKVSDFRSALIQGRLLAKKGLEVFEFRIESGLNCGGHAFASNGVLLPSLLHEFKQRRDDLVAEFRPAIRKFYDEMGWEYPEAAENHRPLVTVQGGIGTHGEARRLHEQFGMDMTGWASPFLLVPEATCVDNATRELLRQATEDDLYLSDVSPLGVVFNNVRNSGSEVHTRDNASKGTPGSPCPKGYLVSNTEFTSAPICLASTEYQTKKLAQIDGSDLTVEEKDSRKNEVLEKTCLCEHLGNGALIALGLVPETNHPQAICPGPNIAWFNRIYSLKEMVDHIYGRGASLVPPERPHMFAKEIAMYVDYFEKLIKRCGYSLRETKTINEFYQNLRTSIEFCLSIAAEEPYEGENLASIPPCVEKQRERMQALFAGFEVNAVVVPA
ncbi:MAG TPA: hypothetical protein VI758_11370 [Bacteroidota bacterium]